MTYARPVIFIHPTGATTNREQALRDERVEVARLEEHVVRLKAAIVALKESPILSSHIDWAALGVLIAAEFGPLPESD